MKTVCKQNSCAGCMACVDSCTQGAIVIKDKLSNYNAIIDENKCIKCGSCFHICPNNNPSNYKEPKIWNQGWANDKSLREKSSSGGVATAFSRAFTESGGIVCSCVFKDGEFKFDFADNPDETKKFSGSKYIKSNPKGMYMKIKEVLKTGKKVLFIGLPCQVSALNNFVGEKLREKLYTVDLICHGSPSPKLLDIFLNQYDISIEKLSTIYFRKKAKFQIKVDSNYISTEGVSDKYSISFLNSLIYTDNCYNCKYAKFKRVSDITLGDSWGNELSDEEQIKGVSLILCQTEKGKQILHSADITLKDVDIKKAVKNNHQLEHPSVMPKERKWFFIKINENKDFNKAVLQALPKQCIKQDVKEILIKFKILK